MLNNFIFSESKSLFEEKLTSNEVDNQAIAFIADTKEIWNHGVYFGSNSGAVNIIRHLTSETDVELTPNVCHKWDKIDNLTISLPNNEDTQVNFYKVVFTVGSDFSISVPYYLKWENDTIPEFIEGEQCELNIEDNRIAYALFPPPAPIGELLEYIENDGTDYILTDINISSSMFGVRCKYSPLFNSGQSNNYALAGTREVNASTPDTAMFIWLLSGTQGRYIYWAGASSGALGEFTNGGIYEDEVLNVQNNVSSIYPIIVFGGNNVGTPTYNNKFRFYYLQLLDSNNNPIVDLRPFKRSSDEAVGIIDTVSGTFYPSVNGTLIGQSYE